MGAQEKRKFTRVSPAEDQPVEVQVIGADFIDIVPARNISEGGAKIEIPHLFQGCDIGQPVDLIIKLPRLRSFRAKGQIKHTAGGDSPAFGVRFTEIGESDRQQVVNYVNERIEAGAIA